MSKITNDGLTRSGTGCFIAVPIRPYGESGRQRVNILIRFASALDLGSQLLMWYCICERWKPTRHTYVSDKKFSCRRQTGRHNLIGFCRWVYAYLSKSI